MSKMTIHPKLAKLSMLGLILLAPLPMVYGQTWQVQGKPASFQIVLEGSACNATKDTGAVTADRSVILTCQGGTWTKPASSATASTPVLSCSLPSAFNFTMAPFVGHVPGYYSGTYPANAMAPNAVATSNPVVISGMTCPSPISASGGLNPQCSVDSGAWGVCAGYLVAGQNLAVRQTTGPDSALGNVVVTVGGFSTVFSVTVKTYRWSAASTVFLGCVSLSDGQSFVDASKPRVVGEVCKSSLDSITYVYSIGPMISQCIEAGLDMGDAYALPYTLIGNYQTCQ